MVFTKSMENLTFDDIQRLKDNQIHESDILDYKKDLIDDDSLIKHVSSFANTSGGYIIFGVEEIGKGGYPKAVPGLQSGVVNKERLEQIILSNVHPRLFIRLREIPHAETNKSILVVQIPNSHLKPHMNLRDWRYYKRYTFEAEPMTEVEVSEAYKIRFVTYERVDDYINELLEYEPTSELVIGQIIIAPSVIDRRIIDTYDKESFSWINPNNIDPQPSGFGYAPKNGYVPGFYQPSAKGIVCRGDHLPFLEIHRNGCVEYRDDFAYPMEDNTGKQIKIFHDCIFCVRLLHTLQFAAMLYSRYNYFGDVRIVASLKNTSNLHLQLGYLRRNYRCESQNIIVKREFPSAMLETEFSWIAAGIMHEIFNHFGIWRCQYFDDKGNYDTKSLAR
jgi:hypothetical protein